MPFIIEWVCLYIINTPYNVQSLIELFEVWVEFRNKYSYKDI